MSQLRRSHRGGKAEGEATASRQRDIFGGIKEALSLRRRSTQGPRGLTPKDPYHGTFRTLDGAKVLTLVELRFPRQLGERKAEGETGVTSFR